MCGRLPGLAHLTDVWRGPLGEVLPEAARRGIVVDCRSAEYATAWRPKGALAERTVAVKVYRDRAAIDPRRPQGLAEALSVHFEVDLRRPDRPGRPYELSVLEPRNP